MDEIRQAAMTYYNTVSADVRASVNEFFNMMDVNKDGKVSIFEFSHFMKELGGELGGESLNNHSFFDEISTDKSNELNKEDIITLYYILKSGRPLCDGCRRLIKGLYFTCETCYNANAGTFNLHPQCLAKTQFIHNHAKFIDNFTLLALARTKRLSNQNAAPAVVNYSKASCAPSSVVLVEMENPTPGSLAIVPAVPNRHWKRMAALKTLEITASLASIANSCTIL